MPRLQAQMSDPEVIGDRRSATPTPAAPSTSSRPPRKLAEEWRLASLDAEGAEELLEEGGEDAEMRDELQRRARAHRARSRRRSASRWSSATPPTTRT